MIKKKKTKKIKEKKKGLSSLTKFTTKSLSGAFYNFKKKQEQKKIKDIKLKNLQENNTLIKERKELRIWEEKLKKEDIKLRSKEDDLNAKEKELKSRDEKQKIENERLIDKDKELIQISKDLLLVFIHINL